jgi:hypothetical protein
MTTDPAVNLYVSAANVRKSSHSACGEHDDLVDVTCDMKAVPNENVTSTTKESSN